MILYKYYSFESGISALKSSQLGFRAPENCNDPFELSFFSQTKSRNNAKANKLKAYLIFLRDDVVILSLTRTPKNHLMWAHYGENHTGFVIGYETNNPFLSSHEYCLITAGEGDVVYTNIKFSPILDFHTLEVLQKVHSAGVGEHINLDEKEYDEVRDLARKIFLTKHASWVYEEEVRIVKFIHSVFEETPSYQNHPYRGFTMLDRQMTPSISQTIVDGLYLYNHKARIKEVYLGVRNPLRERIEGTVNKDFSLVEKAKEERWRVYGLDLSKSSWELRISNLNPEYLEVPVTQPNLVKINGKQLKMLNRKLVNDDFLDNDRLEVTTWNDKIYVKKNEIFI